jgi:hypothetical protein
MHISQRPTKFLTTSEKKFFVERLTTDAPLLSHHLHTNIVFQLQVFLLDRKGGNRMALITNCKLGVP